MSSGEVMFARGLEDSVSLTVEVSGAIFAVTVRAGAGPVSTHIVHLLTLRIGQATLQPTMSSKPYASAERRTSNSEKSSLKPFA